MFAFGRNKELFAMLEAYICELSAAMKQFRKAVSYLMKENADEHFRVLARQMHQHESHADDIRRQIEQYMYRKSLLPETREDLLNIIEMIDKIPNEGQAVLNDVIIQKTSVFTGIRESFLELMEISTETFDFIVEAFRDCFKKCLKVDELNSRVDDNESLGDSFERKMIKVVFDSNLDKAEKIIQRDLIIKLGNICDICEAAMDKIVICSIKRHA
jgi:hypothetical protein